MKRGAWLWGRQTYHHRFRKGFELRSFGFCRIREQCELDQEQPGIDQRDEGFPVLFLQDAFLIHRYGRDTDEA